MYKMAIVVIKDCTTSAIFKDRRLINLAINDLKKTDKY